MAKRDLLRLPDDLEANLRMMLRTPPPPVGTPGSRKAAPKPPAKPKKKRKHRAPAPEPSQAALAAQDKARRERLTKSLTEVGKPKKRKAAKR